MPPLPDYVSPIGVWDPVVVRSLMAHIADSMGQNWVDAFASQLRVSEFVVYGVFVDNVLGGMAPINGPLCHNYYDRIPLSLDDACAFADQMPAAALGAMISSHSRTPHDVRREAFAGVGGSPREVPRGRQTRRASAVNSRWLPSGSGRAP